MLLLSLAIVITGILMVRDGRPIGYYCAGLFALGLLFSAIQLHPRGTFLRLDEKGFTFCALFRSHTVPWAVVQEFGMPHVGVNRRVAWNYTSGYPDHKKSRSAVKSLSGFEAALPDTYGMKARDLAILLESWRQKSVATRKVRSSV
ncbi:MAG: hypothetical protein V4726_15775 [Verrucomicrobiota bacterium]